MRRGRRGVVLMQVLVITVVMGYICAMLLRLMLQPAMYAANAVDGTGRRLDAAAAYNKVTAAWASGGSCSSESSVGLSCSGAGCSCTCTIGAVSVLSAPSGAGDSCRVRVVVP